MKKIVLPFAFCVLFVVTGCSEKGALEKAGERGDEVIDNIKEGENPLKKKGTMEKIGESVDETFSGDK